MVYEINFLVLQSKTVELKKIRKETKEFIESFGAKVIEEKEYLKRKLAYEIKHENYGFFTVLRFEFRNAKNLDELKIKLNQRVNISRYIIVQADGLPSLKEQAVKDVEKIEDDKKSIKSEDIEKVLTEQKKAEIAKKETKPETTENNKKEVAKEEKTPEKKVEEKEDKKEVEVEEVDTKKEGVSLDELDKKLDEILNS